MIESSRTLRDERLIAMNEEYAEQASEEMEILQLLLEYVRK